MKSKILLAIFALLIGAWHSLAQVSVGTGHEELAVSTVAVSITASVYASTGGPATRCYALVEDADVRYSIDGTAPTASVGILALDRSRIPLAGAAIANFQAIRDGGTNASLQIACFRGDEFPMPTTAEVNDFTATSGEVNLLDSGGIAWRAALLTEVAAAAASATYTATFSLPAQSTIVDVQVRNTALWDDGAGATMDCGDADDPNGTYTGVNLVATDLLVGEALTFEHPGGQAGADLTAEQRDFYSAIAVAFTCVATVTTGDGTAGRTHVLIGYAVTDTPTPVSFVDP